MILEICKVKTYMHPVVVERKTVSMALLLEKCIKYIVSSSTALGINIIEGEEPSATAVDLRPSVDFRPSVDH